MKRILISIAALFISASLAFAGFKIPLNVYEMDRLQSAQAKARGMRQPITIVYSDESSSCPMVEEVSLDAIRKLKHRSVIVYANARSKSDRAALPRSVRDELRSPRAGKYIPIVVIMDPELEKVIEIIPYEREEKERRKLFDEATKKIDAYRRSAGKK